MTLTYRFVRTPIGLTILAGVAIAACSGSAPRGSSDSARLAGGPPRSPDPRPATRACLAADSLHDYSNVVTDAKTGDAKGYRISLQRKAGVWSGRIDSWDTDAWSRLDSLALSTATGDVRFRMWTGEASEEFSGRIDCDSLWGSRRRVNGSAAPVAEVYYSTHRPLPDDPPVALASAGVVTAAKDTGVRLDATGHLVLPAVFANACEGEDCESSFTGFACAGVNLRAAPASSAPVVARIARGDTFSVKRSDIHVARPGIVVVKRAFAIESDADMDGGRAHARKDTLRFAAGDSVYLLRYGELGWWHLLHRGKESGAGGFWGTPETLANGALGMVSGDSSRAVLRSQRVREDWWLVYRGEQPLGWWQRDAARTLRSVFQMQHWEDYCPDGTGKGMRAQ